MNKDATYLPLPEKLTIRNSEVHGLGLFATEAIREAEIFGMSHIEIDDELIRTPLGGFYNHSDNPNCMKYREGNKYFLVAINDIKKGEEITVEYTFYNIQEEILHK